MIMHKDHAREKPVLPRRPGFLPRLVQKAIWLFCAEAGLGICNDNQIEDSRACESVSCPVFQNCPRVPLRPARLPEAA
jgi:hypothetical protein